jgi:hypothetical protein
MTDRNDTGGLSSQEEKAITAAVEGVAETEQATVQDVFVTTSSGAVIRAKPVPESLIQRAYSQYPASEPPMVEIKQGAKAYLQPNYDDPGYLRQNSRRAMQIGEVILRLQMLYGLEIVSLPPTMSPFEEDTTWVEELEAAGLEVPPESKPVARRLEWIRLRILPTNGDIAALSRAENVLFGISEADVQAAMELFRRTGSWTEP